MVNTSHSRSVRGTLSHPSSTSHPPSLSDATSLTPENASIPLPTHDSAPPPSSSSHPTDSASDEAADSAPTPSTPYRTQGTTAAGGGDKRAVGNRATGNPAKDRKEKSEEDEEPHSRQVRGTLGNKKSEAKVQKTMLGDPASLVVEDGEKKMDEGVEREGVEKGKGKRERESKL